MSRSITVSSSDIEQLDRFYREGGLAPMASPHVHYDDGHCPHPDCPQRFDWIDFKLELFGEPERVYKPLVRSWWEGAGFVGRCPACSGWVHFTTRGLEAVDEETARRLPGLPEGWHAVAQFA